MPRKTFKGNTENLNLLKNKISYIGFELEKVPEFLKNFTPLNYNVPKVYDETSYKVYKYVDVKNIDIMITPKDRLDELSERYATASPLFTYMKPENNEDIEKYAYFLKMINQTNTYDIEKIEEEQENFQKEIPIDVKFPNNFKWQVFYSEYADRYFMLASTKETDNSTMFYLLKKKIETNKSRKKSPTTVFIPISNEEYTGKILKKSEIEDVENYLWYFTKNWPSIYEITDQEGNTFLQIVGETVIFDKMTSKYRIILKDKKEAQKWYKQLKALFILAYEIPNEYAFDVKINQEGGIEFLQDGRKIEYDNLADFIKEEAILKIKENEKLENENTELKADVKDLQKKAEEQTQEYLRKEREIYAFLECKKTFMGRIKYFFKGKKSKEPETEQHSANKDRLKDILNQDKNEIVHYSDAELESKSYTVEDIIKIGKTLENTRKENKNAKLDLKAAENKFENLERKIKNATEYLEEIDKHKKSIFEFWKYANKDESKMLVEAESVEEEKRTSITKAFDYEGDIEKLANKVDMEQREKLSHDELNALFASNYVLEGINLVSKKKLSKSDEEDIINLLDDLQEEYKENLETIEEKDFDIFGNVSEDKTKIKKLKNNKHRENEKNKFEVLGVNLNTELSEFIEKLRDIRENLESGSDKIDTPYDLPVYKASNQVLDTEGFDKFSINPWETLNNLEKIATSKETNLYKINVPENTKLMFFSNIAFYENDNHTLPLGMDVSQEILINLDLYTLELKNKTEFNMNISKDEFTNYVKNVKVYEYNLISKK